MMLILAMNHNAKCTIDMPDTDVETPPLKLAIEAAACDWLGRFKSILVATGPVTRSGIRGRGLGDILQTIKPFIAWLSTLFWGEEEKYSEEKAVGRWNIRMIVEFFILDHTSIATDKTTGIKTHLNPTTRKLTFLLHRYTAH